MLELAHHRISERLWALGHEREVHQRDVNRVFVAIPVANGFALA
jgi:hypothetical protein